MSSYISEAYLIEDRRLQEIVRQCQSDLEKAMQDVCVQQIRMMNLCKQRQQDDAEYNENQKKAANRLEYEYAEMQRKRQEKKKKLKSELHLIHIQLKVVSEERMQLVQFFERQKVLESIIETEDADLDNLEEKITQHKYQVEQELAKTLVTDAVKQIRQNSQSEIVANRHEKMVSLKTGGIEQLVGKTMEKRKSPADTFAEKLQSVLSSSYAKRFPSVLVLKKEFEAQAEYSKAVFAVKNMSKLDKVLQQLEMLASKQKNQEEFKTVIVDKYIALCRMLDIEYDEKLIVDEVETRKLVQVCEELWDKYQERKGQEYVTNAIATVMERHNIEFQHDSDESDGRKLHFHMEDASLEVYGTEDNLMKVEVAGEYEGDQPTINERRKGTASARHFCSVMKKIEEELVTEFGIQFRKIVIEEPDEQTIAMKKKSDKVGTKQYNYGRGYKLDSIS